MSAQTIQQLTAVMNRMEHGAMPLTKLVLIKNGESNLNKIEALTVRLNSAEEQKRRWQALFDKGGVGIAIIDRDGAYVEANDKYCKLLGREKLAVIGKVWQELRTGKISAEHRTVFDEFAIGQREDYYSAVSYNKPDGQISHFLVNAVAIRGLDGEMLYLIVVAQDLEEGAKAWQQIS